MLPDWLFGFDYVLFMMDWISSICLYALDLGQFTIFFKCVIQDDH